MYTKCYILIVLVTIKVGQLSTARRTSGVSAHLIDTDIDRYGVSGSCVSGGSLSADIVAISALNCYCYCILALLENLY